jgi:hypothetical protein
MAFLSHLVEVEVFLTCEKRHSFLNFSYVCPEPVLVKCSFYIYIWLKKWCCSHLDGSLGRRM